MKPLPLNGSGDCPPIMLWWGSPSIGPSGSRKGKTTFSIVLKVEILAIPMMINLFLSTISPTSMIKMGPMFFKISPSQWKKEIKSFSKEKRDLAKPLCSKCWWDCIPRYIFLNRACIGLHLVLNIHWKWGIVLYSKRSIHTKYCSWYLKKLEK